MNEVVLLLLCILLGAVLLGTVVGHFKVVAEKNKQIKDLEKQVTESYERIQKQMEIINGLETGSPDDQFDFSVDILHQFAKNAQAKAKRS